MVVGLSFDERWRRGFTSTAAATATGAATAGVLGLALARLYALFLHRQRAVDAVQLEVETARVTHRLAFVVATPQCRRRRVAVGALQAHAP